MRQSDDPFRPGPAQVVSQAHVRSVVSNQPVGKGRPDALPAMLAAGRLYIHLDLGSYLTTQLDHARQGQPTASAVGLA